MIVSKSNNKHLSFPSRCTYNPKPYPFVTQKSSVFIYFLGSKILSCSRQLPPDAEPPNSSGKHLFLWSAHVELRGQRKTPRVTPSQRQAESPGRGRVSAASKNTRLGSKIFPPPFSQQAGGAHKTWGAFLLPPSPAGSAVVA